MRIGLLITARLKSSRLPFKLLRDLNGYSIIEHVINRSKHLYGADEIVLCTSTNPQDKPLVDVAKNNDIFYYLGSEEDVLKRLLDAAIFFNYDYVICITGENPLYSIEYANQIIDKVKREKPDFITIEGLPIGCAVYALNVKALKTICEIKQEVDTEIWGPLFNRPEIFNIQKIEADSFFTRPQLRLTNDYPEDFHLMSKIFNNFPCKSTPSLHSALEILDENPELLQLNSMRVQASLDDETINRINSFFIENHDRIIDLKNKIYNNDI
ncbi:3-deoxy-manno-octulosonate cytidylyltransferase [Chryseobacterium sp.]|uniref:cytidylyltransferase domain-containing protein n=1 Tax=Chryseobacterium sp. TaxID=1871047 RepID=UPI0025BDB5A2|nr:3-deoxy-manno-octulosonate cytidylyltransferase [Chryseobacterium sp.]